MGLKVEERRSLRGRWKDGEIFEVKRYSCPPSFQKTGQKKKESFVVQRTDGSWDWGEDIVEDKGTLRKVSEWTWEWTHLPTFHTPIFLFNVYICVWGKTAIFCPLHHRDRSNSHMAGNGLPSHYYSLTIVKPSVQREISPGIGSSWIWLDLWAKVVSSLSNGPPFIIIINLQAALMTSFLNCTHSLGSHSIHPLNLFPLPEEEIGVFCAPKFPFHLYVFIITIVNIE